ncbi:hypothetical protein RB596_004471 [Gaeumannomyces avenae]
MRKKPQGAASEEGPDAAALAKRTNMETPSLLQRMTYASWMYTTQSILSGIVWFHEWKEWYSPPDGRPDIVKAYDCRPYLPVRIFFPAEHDQSSPTLLPTLITIHGGGFCIGTARDADEWNRDFANKHKVLVVSLSYSKAPASPFPGALHDLQAVYGAVLGDESLPIARAGATTGGADGRARIAILGWSAGGNLALTLSQLASVRDSRYGAPAAAVTVYGALDLATPPAAKVKSRVYKVKLPQPRGQWTDSLLQLAPVLDWSYVPYGQDLRDPLLSPAYAPEAALPPYVCVVACELDMLAHESWRFAVRLANERRLGGGGRDLPDVLARGNMSLTFAGRRAPSRRRGELEEEEGGDERFGFDDEADDGRGGVKWMLVPDVLHGFDCKSMREMMGGEETIKDAEMKTVHEIERIGRWLREKAWKA